MDDLGQSDRVLTCVVFQRMQLVAILPTGNARKLVHLLELPRAAGLFLCLELQRAADLASSAPSRASRRLRFRRVHQCANLRWLALAGGDFIPGRLAGGAGRAGDHGCVLESFDVACQAALELVRFEVVRRHDVLVDRRRIRRGQVTSIRTQADAVILLIPQQVQLD